MRLLEWIRTISGTERRKPRGGPQDTSLQQPEYETDPEDSETDPFNPFPEPIQLPLSDVIDLHTIPARDVKRAVEEYLQQANEAQFPAVRIIHGKGIGVQRELVRSILSRTSFVIDWIDAPPQAGGLGATIVRLRRK
jgi:dsDNA-specific endonuclease/ATPase MutS2